MVKTDYAAHDAKYRALRTAGAPGWDSAEEYIEREVELHWAEDAFAAAGARGNRVLELGCGAGNVAAWLAERGYDVTGIDISETAIAWAIERNIPRAQSVVGDVLGAGFFCIRETRREDRRVVLLGPREESCE